MKKYRVGLIGCGFIGKVHAYGYNNLPLFYNQSEFGAEITHVCTSNPESARKSAATVGASCSVTDYREITENPEVDIVSICTPNELHKEELLSAMRNGKHIYCDKPITATYAEAREIEAALGDYAGIAQMTFQNRFFPSTLRAKQLMAEGAIGEVLEFRGNYLHSGSSDPSAPFKWKLAAGTVADLGSHILDLLNHLLGDFSEVAASTHIAYADRPSVADPAKRVPVTAEDNMQLLLRLPNGATGTVTASKIATGTEDEIGFEIHGTKGAIKLVPGNFDKLCYYNAATANSPLGGVRGWTAIDCGQRYRSPAGFPTPKASIGWLRGHVHCLWNFLESVHAGRQPEPSLRQGIRIQKLLEQVNESAAKKCWLKLD